MMILPHVHRHINSTTNPDADIQQRVTSVCIPLRATIECHELLQVGHSFIAALEYVAVWKQRICRKIELKFYCVWL